MDHPKSHPHHPQLVQKAISEMLVGTGLWCAGMLQLIAAIKGPEGAQLFFMVFGILNIIVGMYLMIPAWVMYRKLLAEHK